jgi:GT2 family glycosyltransferase
MNLENLFTTTYIPNIAVATISLYRYAILLNTLRLNPKTTNIPLNICLRIQAAEKMPIDVKLDIIQILEVHYANYDLQFTFKNHGSGVPRHDVVHRALKHFNPDYIITLDDDIILSSNSINLLANILNENKELGAVSLWCNPAHIVWRIKGDNIVAISHLDTTKEFEYVDGIGSGTTLTRKEVYTKCQIDTNYYIGWADIDFCMQMKQAGWKIGIVTHPQYRALNPNVGSPSYFEIRRDPKMAEISKNRFCEKWGLKIIDV